jgi:hypothetical protein
MKKIFRKWENWMTLAIAVCITIATPFISCDAGLKYTGLGFLWFIVVICILLNSCKRETE